MGKKIYRPFTHMEFDYDHCFLCGVALTHSNKTDEHVIPTWLQHRHKLWNQKLKLPNQTHITYKQLKIPCCKECNNEHLGKIEQKIEKQSHSYKDFITLDKKIIFQWLIKIYYGLLFKDLSLLIDRRYPKKGTIISEESLSNCKMIHEFLQSTRLKINFMNNVFSLFVFKLHLDPRNDSKHDFLYTDDHDHTQLAIQFGEIGIICCIAEDGIINESMKNYLDPFLQHTLHPIQFSELIATIFYKRACLHAVPTHMLYTSKNKYLIASSLSTPLDQYFREPVFKEHGLYIYYYLRRFGLKFEQIYYPESDANVTFLLKDNGNLHLLDAYGNPFSDINIKHEHYNGELFPIVERKSFEDM